MAYQTSTQFHNAVLSGSPNCKALLAFGDDFFNDYDIDGQSGLTFTDYFNPDEEVMIGGTPSSTLNVNIINDLGLLDTLKWDVEFPAYLGVETVIESYSNAYGGILYASINGVVVTVDDTPPYIYCNGTALTDQPSDPVAGLWIYKDIMYAISEDGTATKYSLSGSTWTQDTTYVQSAFMINKFKTEFYGRSVSFDGHYLREFTFNDNVPETWGDISTNTWGDISVRTWGSFGNVQAQVTEYVPLGYFKTSRPKVLSSASVEIEAYDRMVKLEKIADSWFNNLAFPKSINQIIEAFCTQYGLQLDNSLYVDPLPNGTLTYSSRPANIENMTAREVLSYLAEVTCSTARFTRDGKLRFDWFKTNSITIPWWFEQTVYSYDVSAITGVTIRSSEDDAGQSYGTSDNPYIITDNPLLPGTIAPATLQTIAQNIYTRLSTYAPFPPSTASITSDWSIESGDILTINGVSVPVYTQTVTYNGGALATIENTGEEVRPVDSAVSREAFNVGVAVATVEKSVEGIIAATQNNKLTFDEDGLHILNGGFDILNANGSKVFYADGSGNLSMLGDFVSMAPVDSYYDSNLDETYYLWQGVRINNGRVDLRYAVMPDGINPSPDILPPDWYGAFSAGIQYDSSEWTSGETMADYVSGDMFCNVVRATNVYANFLYGELYGETYNTDISYGTGTNAAWADVVLEDGSTAKQLIASSSSRKYKKNIKPIETETSKIIDALKPITYEDKSSESGTKYYGFIAEDVEKVCPMLVQHNKDGEPESLMYDRITVLLADDNKKLRKRIDELETRLAKLETLIGGK